jgi:serine protease Do
MRGAGTRVKLEIWRKGRTLELIVRLQEAEGPRGRAQAEDPPAAEELAGVSSGIDGVGVGAVSADMLKRAGVDEEGAVIVLSIHSSASVTGLRRGDLIVEADSKSVHSAAELREAVRHSNDPVLVRVRRPEGCVYLSLNKH